MTRKDYARFAEALSKEYASSPGHHFPEWRAGYRGAIQVMMAVFKKDSPSFSEDRFKEACKEIFGLPPVKD